MIILMKLNKSPVEHVKSKKNKIKINNKNKNIKNTWKDKIKYLEIFYIKK